MLTSVCEVNDYADTRFSRISSQKLKFQRKVFTCSNGAQVEFFLFQKSIENRPSHSMLGKIIYILNRRLLGFFTLIPFNIVFLYSCTVCVSEFGWYLSLIWRLQIADKERYIVPHVLPSLLLYNVKLLQASKDIFHVFCIYVSLIQSLIDRQIKRMQYNLLLPDEWIFSISSTLLYLFVSDMEFV